VVSWRSVLERLVVKKVSKIRVDVLSLGENFEPEMPESSENSPIGVNIDIISTLARCV